MIIYINGCSHSRHFPKIGYTSFSYHLANNFKIPLISTMEIHQFVKTKSFERKFNEIIKNDNFVWNSATDGKGNDSIYFETITNVTRLIDENKKPDLVSIQWSGPARRLITIYDKSIYLRKGELSETEWDGFILNCNPHDFSYMYPHFEPLGSFITLFYIYSLQEFLKNNNINYTFHCYMPLDSLVETQYLYKKLNLDNFVSFDDDKHPILDGWIDFVRETNLNEDKFGHPNQKGKKYITHRIQKKLQDLYNIPYSDYDRDFFKLI